MKEFISKWSNWWILNSKRKQLDEAFEKELSQLIEREATLRIHDVVGRSELIASASERLSLDEINKQAKEWAKERSVGNKEQDDECEYDFKCGMLAARSFLNTH